MSLKYSILFYSNEPVGLLWQVMVKSLEKELALLKRELAMHDTLANRSQVNYDPLSEQQRYEIRQQARNFVDGKSTEIDVRSTISRITFIVWGLYLVPSVV